jgi:hypothetical protein
LVLVLLAVVPVLLFPAAAAAGESLGALAAGVAIRTDGDVSGVGTSITIGADTRSAASLPLSSMTLLALGLLDGSIFFAAAATGVFFTAGDCWGCLVVRAAAGAEEGALAAAGAGVFFGVDVAVDGRDAAVAAAGNGAVTGAVAGAVAVAAVAAGVDGGGGDMVGFFL